MTPRQAAEALDSADRRVEDALTARDHAAVALDRALADNGWTRLVGAFSPGATALYTSREHPDPLQLHQVLTLLDGVTA